MMRFVLLVVLLLVGTTLVADEQKPPPRKLTKRQIAEGWINLFDGETLFGWRIPDGTKWTIFKGMLAPQGEDLATLVTTTPFDNFEFVLEYQSRGDKCELVFGIEMPGDKLPEIGKGLKLESTGVGHGTLTGSVQAGMLLSTSLTISDPVGLGGLSTGTFSKVDMAPFVPKPGLIALRGSSLVVKALRIRPINPKLLFNGKDLTGWKVFEGKKAKFGVANGCITAKDGPGDLATEGQYSDFLLQVECKTNGKHLNSGVFFRAIPGQYQNGYEAQIHNGWQDKAKTVDFEVYDPKTNELKEKQKLETLAMDYGTGAIYRRIPARKQLADDDEWFTMTVVATGRHIATWVNGIQTVDWDDNRPTKENPRQGCRLEKGTISLQAHDPTTDLLFRNIWIADLSAKKTE
jgi:hypothetical protein